MPMRSLNRFIPLLWLFFVAPLSADAPPEPAPRRVGFGPERILLALSADPTHSQVVTWRTRDAVAAAEAQIAPASASATFNERAASVKAVSEALKINNEQTVYHHVALFEGLTPDTAYCYRVGGGGVWSEWFTFKTAADKDTPFRFVFIGDMQNAIFSHCSRVVRKAFRTVPESRLFLFSGDLVAEGYDDVLWGEFCDALGFIGAEVPVLASPGNHDMHALPDWLTNKKMDSVPDTWRAHFCFPHNGPEGVSELRDEAYYFDYQGVRFISLDTSVFCSSNFKEEKRVRIQKAQLEWLERLLQTNHCRWVVLLMHYPIYSAGKDRDNIELREALLPLIDKYGVDLVLQGHDHVYARSEKLYGGKVAPPDAPGTVYVISAAGFKTYPVNPRFEDLMAVMDTGKQYFQVVEATPERLEYRSFAADGSLHDAFRLVRKKSGKTEYVDKSPQRREKRKHSEEEKAEAKP